MDLQFTAPPAFLVQPVESPILWPRWHKSLGPFIASIGLTNADVARLKAMLIHRLGTHGQRIFLTLGPA